MKKLIVIFSIFLMALFGSLQGVRAQATITNEEISCFYVAAQRILAINFNATSYMGGKASKLQTSFKRIYEIFQADLENNMPNDLTSLEQKEYQSVKPSLLELEKQRKQAITDYFESAPMTYCLSEDRFNYILEKTKNDTELVNRIRKLVQNKENE